MSMALVLVVGTALGGRHVAELLRDYLDGATGKEDIPENTAQD